MANSKVQDLTKRVFSSLANLTGVRLWSGKTGEANALGIELPELLSSSAVADDSALDYKMLTPKGFALSTALTTRKGINRLSTDAEVTAKTGTGQIKSDQQGLMQTQWFKDWFVANGSVKNYTIPVEDFSDAKAIQYNATWQGDLAAGVNVRLMPADFPTTSRFGLVYFTISLVRGGS
jgi:hypothetical protein